MASSNGRRRGHHVAAHDVLRAATAAILGIGRERGHDQVGFTASTKLVSMKVAKSGRRLICFSASMWSA